MFSEHIVGYNQRNFNILTKRSLFYFISRWSLVSHVKYANSV